MARTIVIMHPGGLGDVLLAVPAMLRMRTRFPAHRFILWAGDQVAQLLLACGVIDEWMSVQGRGCMHLFAGEVDAQVQACLKDCDLAIGWLEDREGMLCETLQRAGVRKVCLKSPFAESMRAVHQRDRFFEAIDEAPFDGGGEIPVPDLLRGQGSACLQALGVSSALPFVVMHPGSGSAHKCVEPELFAAVVAALQSVGVAPVILEGPADCEPVERLLSVCVSQPAVLKGLDLLTLAGVLVHASLFVGQDSGVTHLAGLMGVRTVALFGPTDPARWAPLGTHVTVVRGASCQCHSWDAVSRCEAKPCLAIQQDELVALCLAQVNGTAIG